MHHSQRSLFFWLRTSAICLLLCAPVDAGDSKIRIATFNISFNRTEAGQLLRDLKAGSQQARQVAEILRTVRPDIVLLNEFDYDSTGESIRVFQEDYLQADLLESAETQTAPIEYKYSYTGPVNAGVPSGLDLNRNGKTTDNADSWGYGAFSGQYGMVVLSRHPIDLKAVRTFRKLKWMDLPGASMPVHPDESKSWYPQDTWQQLRLSSKSHWDVPIRIGKHQLHVLACHPTPPAFDGPEDRNGRRNHDEIRLWKEYLSDRSADWLIDDAGKSGGFSGTHFVICGDLNADPMDGSSHQNAIQQLLDHENVNAKVTPSSKGGVEAAKIQGLANTRQKGDPLYDTSDFSDRSVGNLRVDYVLPSKSLMINDSGVFWPEIGQPLAATIACSDHRLVWVDVVMTATE